MFKESDIFVCPSRHEPLGNVILEAWANKIPVIAANSAGPNELIKNDLNGIIFPIDDIESLSKSISKLSKNKNNREKLIDNGYKSFKEKFTKDLVVNNYYNFFKRIIE